jgi:hypothetical protein
MRSEGFCFYIEFATLRKATISFAMSAHLSALIQSPAEKPDDFYVKIK